MPYSVDSLRPDSNHPDLLKSSTIADVIRKALRMGNTLEFHEGPERTIQMAVTNDYSVSVYHLHSGICTFIQYLAPEPTQK